MEKPRIKRSRKGCFACRSRKKKCDETKPICSSCKRNFLVCEWPAFRNQTLKNHQGVTANVSSIKFSNYKDQSISDVVVDDDSSVMKRLIEGIEDGILREEHCSELYGRFICVKVVPKIIRNLFYDLFLCALSEDYSKNTAMCLAAAILYNDGLISEKLVRERHAVALKGLLMKISEKDFDPSMDSFLHSISLLVVAENLMHYDFRKTLTHLDPAFKTIIQRINKDFQVLKSNFSFKVFVDSLIYHYCTNLLSYPLKDLEKLPDPFELEERLSKIYSGGAIWNEHPVLGPCADPFMLAFKAAYLFKFSSEKSVFPLVIKNLATVQERFDMLSQPDNDFSVLEKMVLTAAALLMMRILNPLFTGNHPAAQHYLASTIDDLLKFNDTSTFEILGCWPVFITCISISDPKTRGLLEIWLRQNISMHPNSIVPVIKDVWDTDQGIEVLFDLELMQSVSLS